jgi:hypothetical protein
MARECRRFRPASEVFRSALEKKTLPSEILKMTALSQTKQHWLDRIAISMAVICGIHCLVTPVLLVALPILATTFWVDSNFHLWMLLLVLPTTSLAVWSGCRRHKDKWVLAAAIVGLTILTASLVWERSMHAHAHSPAEPNQTGAEVVVGPGTELAAPDTVVGGCCALHPINSGSDEHQAAFSLSGLLAPHALFNTLGGFFLILGHTRNFMLCRRDKCSHAKGVC